MAGLNLISLSSIFIIAAAVIWFAGVMLTKATATIDSRFKIGDALGGLIFLGISGSLTEVAIIFSAARSGHTAIIIGSLLGGIAIQTLLLVLFDFTVNKKKSLASLVGSPILAIETAFAITIAILALIGTFIPASRAIFNVNPLSIIIVLAWLVGLLVINKARKVAHLIRDSKYNRPGNSHHQKFFAQKKNWQVFGVFILASVAILIAGIFLEKTGAIITSQLGISSGIFAATIMALAAALPEISTGLESIFIGDAPLSISSIMGGNAFMLTCFLLADILSGNPVLSFARQPDKLLLIIGIAMMTVSAIAFLGKPQKTFCRLGVDSICQILIYGGGIIALAYIK